MDLPPRDAVDHRPGRPQRWTDVDPDIRSWVDGIVELVAELDGLVGVYLHGSLAMGGFHRPKSDVDLLIVTDAALTDDRRRSLAAAMLRLFDERPITGGVETSVLLRSAVGSFRHPAPFEFHFSESWADEVRQGSCGTTGTDPDLAAHCTVVRSRGLALVGPPPSSVFGEVRRGDYLDAVLDDLRWIVDGGILDSPFYGVLNICRCAHVLLGGADLPPTKEEGGRWALEHLPEVHHRLVTDALECYRSGALVPIDQRRHHGHRWDAEPLLALAEWARNALVTSS